MAVDARVLMDTPDMEGEGEKKTKKKENVPSLGVAQRGEGIRSRSLDSPEMDDEVTQGRIRLSILRKLPPEMGSFSNRRSNREEKRIEGGALFPTLKLRNAIRRRESRILSNNIRGKRAKTLEMRQRWQHSEESIRGSMDLAEIITTGLAQWSPLEGDKAAMQPCERTQLSDAEIFQGPT